MMEFVLSIAALGFGVALGFVLHGAEAAAIAANRGRFRTAETMGDREAADVMDLLDNLRRILGAAAAGRALALVAAVLGTRGLLSVSRLESMAIPYAPLGVDWADLAAVLLVPPCMLALNEALARAVFRRNADAALRALVLPLRILGAVLAPLSERLQAAARALLRPLGGAAAGRPYPRDDLARLFGASPAQPRNAEEAGQSEALLDTSGRSMIHNIVDLERTRAREIMRPLIDIVTVRLGEMDLKGLKDLARRTGYSRFPVYQDRIIRMLGYVSVYDVLQNQDPARNSLENYVRETYFAPELMRAKDLLQEFLERRLPAAIIVDEYGACSGWVTREDLLGEIIGEIEDELDRKPWGVLRAEADGSFVCEGPCNIDELNEALDARFPKEGFETLSGWVYDALGRIPAPGESAPFENFNVTVEEMDGPAIKKLRVRRT